MAIDYLLCDLEATGNRNHDRVIELGLVVYHGSLDDPTPEIYSGRNSTDIEMMTEAMELHHITPDMLHNEKPLKDTAGYKRVNQLNTPNNIFVAHDVPSDLKYLQREGFVNQMKTIDTLKCTKHLFGELDAYRLQYLRYKLALYRDETTLSSHYPANIKAHSALSDVWVMRLLLSRLIVELQKTYQTTTEMETTNKLIELSTTPIVIKKFPFGRYKGEYIDEIAESDYRYIEWARETLTLDEDMVYTLDYYL